MSATQYIVWIVILLGGWAIPMQADTVAIGQSSFAARKQLIEELLDNNLGFTKEIHFNEVLRYAPSLEQYYKTHKDRLHLFQLQELTVYIHATKGDVVKASKICKQLIHQAQEQRYLPGLVLGYHSEGLIFLNTNMLKEAHEKFGEAYSLLAKMPPNDCLKEVVLLQYVPVCLHLNLMGESARLLEDLYRLGQTSGRKLSQLMAECFYTYYYNQQGDYPKAKSHLLQAEALYEQHPFPYHESFLLYAELSYARATHDVEMASHYYARLVEMNQREEIQRNLLEYNELLAEYYLQTGNDQAACQIFNQLHAANDSVQKHHYNSQIEMLRTVYQIDHKEMSNRRGRNRLLMACIVGCLLILGCTTLYILLYRRVNARLKRSRLELEAARAKAENSIRAKSLFLSNMSHEIRTPLNALAGFSSILVEEGVDDETRRQCSEIICLNSDLLQKLIADIVDLSTIELGQMKFNFGKHNATEICRGVADTIEHIKQTSAEVRFETSLDACPLYTDKARLQQVLINLMVNATKFTKEGHITLKLEKQDEQTLLFSISDTGCGIPADRREQIFRRFEKLNEEAQGSGLGLSICQVIIEHIGGRIWIDPDYSDGARFCFTHPIHPDTERKEATA